MAEGNEDQKGKSGSVLFRANGLEHLEISPARILVLVSFGGLFSIAVGSITAYRSAISQIDAIVDAKIIQYDKLNRKDLDRLEDKNKDQKDVNDDYKKRIHDMEVFLSKKGFTF